MTAIHIFPIVEARAVPREIAESRALFLAREAVTVGTSLHCDVLLKTLRQLAQSSNAAIVVEARRLMAVLA